MTEPHLYTEARLATLPPSGGYGILEDGLIAIEAGRIAYAGPASGLPASYVKYPQTNLSGRLVTPGLIDCHTHLIHGGSRAHEFEMRQNGASYEDILRAGGGIFSTVEATRAASDADLSATALKRLDRLITEGVTCVEIKSGYGLDQETELRMLRIARQLETLRPVRIRTSFLGAHAAPSGTDPSAYLNEICLPTLREAAAEGLVDMVDGFCEPIAFSRDQIETLFQAAKKLGLPIKLHAEQLSDSGGAALAAEYGALSVDHLEYVRESGIVAMAKAGTVAVLLPGAFYFLNQTRPPPVSALRAAGVPLAVATDCNPGSSPMTSLLLAMNMAATLFGLTPEEALRGVTVNAARALGLANTGTLHPGNRADLAIWDVSDPAELTYRIGDAPLYKRIFGGAICEP